MGPTSPSPRQVHNILGREGRDLLWIFPMLFCSFPSRSLRSVAEKTLYNMQHVRLVQAIVAFFIQPNEQAEHQHQQLVKNGDHFVTNQAVALVLSKFHCSVGCAAVCVLHYSLIEPHFYEFNTKQNFCALPKLLTLRFSLLQKKQQPNTFTLKNFILNTHYH